MDTNARLDDLKQKYRSVFQLMEEQRISLGGVRIENDKLSIEGAAHSADARKRLIEELARVDPRWDNEVILDLHSEDQQPGMPNTGQTVVNTSQDFSKGSGQ